MHPVLAICSTLESIWLVKMQNKLLSYIPLSFLLRLDSEWSAIILPIRIGIFGSLIISNYNSFKDTENIRSLLWFVLINYSDMIDQFAKHAFFDFWYLKKRTIIYWNSLPGQHGQTDRVKFDISNIKTSHMPKVHFFQKIFFVKVWRVYNVGVIKETIT